MAARHTMLLSFWVAAGAACATSGGLPAGRPLHDDSPGGTWHVVKDGETWAELASRNGVPLEDLLEINGVDSVEPLKEGRVIYLLDGDVQHRRPAPARLAETGPWMWPLQTPRLSSPFGRRDGRDHEGIDLSAPIGTTIRAAREGFVLYAGDGVRGYGNMVVVQHADNVVTVYAHGSLLLVRTGDRIDQGQEIARVGQSGRATAPHLHFEVRRGEVPVDPMSVLPALP